MADVPGSAAPVVPLTPAIRRQLLIDAAKEMLTAEPFGPVMTPEVYLTPEGKYRAVVSKDA